MALAQLIEEYDSELRNSVAPERRLALEIELGKAKMFLNSPYRAKGSQDNGKEKS